jgi:chromosome segregation ATPase
MSATVETDDQAQTTCGLPGCDVQFAQVRKGGRPRIYCSDAHRNEANRLKRLSEGAPETDPARVLDGLEEDLVAALSRMRTVATGGPNALEVAKVRAAATAGVLQAQQETEVATEKAVELADELEAARVAWGNERGALQEAVAGGLVERDAALEEVGRQESVLADLRARHAVEMAEIDQRHQTAVAAHTAELADLRELFDREREARARAEARLEDADRRAAEADKRTEVANLELRELEVNTARKDAAAEAAAVRAREVETDLRRAVNAANEQHRVESAEASAELDRVRDQLATSNARLATMTERAQAATSTAHEATEKARDLEQRLARTEAVPMHSANPSAATTSPAE